MKKTSVLQEVVLPFQVKINIFLALFSFVMYCSCCYIDVQFNHCLPLNDCKLSNLGVTGVMASCKFNYFVYSLPFKLPVKQHSSDFSPLKPGKTMLISPERIA